MHQRPNCAHAELPFKAEPDIDRDPQCRSDQCEKALFEQFARHFARDRSTPSIRTLGWSSLILATIFSAMTFASSGFLSAPSGGFIRIETWFSAPKRWMVGSPYPNSPTNSRSAFQPERPVHRRRSFSKLATDKIHAEIQATRRDQRDGCDHQQDRNAEGDTRHLRKPILVLSGTSFKSFMVRPLASNIQDLFRTGALDPARHPHPCKGHCREHRCHDADHQNHGKAADRARAKDEEQHSGNDVGDIRVENRTARFLITIFDGLDDTFGPFVVLRVCVR